MLTDLTLRKKVIRTLTVISLTFIIKLLLKSLRIKRYGPTINGGVVLFPHGEQLPLLLARPNQPLLTPVSWSKDGELQASIMPQFGINVTRGSSSKGGFKALRQCVNALKKNHTILIAADGPRGPRGTSKLGFTLLLKKTKCPLWICRAVCKYSIRLKTWDRFMIPLPFTMVELYTEKIEYSSDLSAETIADMIGERLI